MGDPHPRPAHGRPGLLSILLLLASAVHSSAQTPPDLGNLTLEELGNVEVTTVSRTPEPVGQTPAAIYVITQDDIHRSGARSLAEALRLAPGVQVSQVDADHWAIGIRGFAGPLTRSVLVLIDGRAVYDPLFAGTYWDVQDTMLEDVDRIEVIRGPGGTLWGANAINGIINIITKPAAETQGGLVTAGAGNAEYGAGAIRYGGAAGDYKYRVYAKTTHRGPSFHTDGNEFDDSKEGQGGFRLDRAMTSGQAFTLEGDLYDHRAGELSRAYSYTPPYSTPLPITGRFSGGNVLGRWSSPAQAMTGFQLQAYYDHTNRDETLIVEHRDTLDVDFQQSLKQWPRQELLWGAGYRAMRGNTTALPPASVSPETRVDHLFSAFAQDQVTLIPNRVRVDGGAKIEHNSFTGFEVQPSGRVLWTPAPGKTIFASVTRAVRTPSPVETDFSTDAFTSLNRDVPVFLRLTGNPEFDSETLTAYEAGYRMALGAPAYVRIASFYNRLGRIESTEFSAPFFEVEPSPHFVLPVVFGNGLHGDSVGGEIVADVRATSWWRFTGSYSYARVRLSKLPGSTDVSAEQVDEGSNPRHQAQIRTDADLPGGWSADWSLRYVGRLNSGPVPSYVTWNVRVARALAGGLELALIGQNLAAAHQLEWAGTTENRRTVDATLTWRW